MPAEALLLGLSLEDECRAALLLIRYGIDPAAIRRRWPELRECAKLVADGGAAAGGAALQDKLGNRLRLRLAATLESLASGTEPVDVATEHLLLGLAAAEDDVGRWLRGRGLSPETVAAEIQRVYGHPVENSADTAAIDWVDREPGGVADPSEPGRAGPVFPGRHAPALNTSVGDGSSERHAPALSADVGLLRILDAAANRAREGLRVVEDYTRFVLDDRHLTQQLKNLRHRLTAALAAIPLHDRLAARETQADVGTSLVTPGEQQRSDGQQVLWANFGRLQEALRSLEEFSKVDYGPSAAEFEQVRYQTYTLQRTITATTAGMARLAAARLYVLVDGRATPEEFEALAAALVAAAVDVIQLRDKGLGDRALLARARRLRELTAGSRTLFIVNDRPDLAVLAGADGVHVGQDELTVKDARTIVGLRRLVGVSTHSLEQARQAVLDGADYIGVGPTFPSATKSFPHFPGLELVRAVAAEIRLPAFAIGGITAANVAGVLAAGMPRVAVSGAISGVADPAAAARELIHILKQGATA